MEYVGTQVFACGVDWNTTHILTNTRIQGTVQLHAQHTQHIFYM